MLGKLQSLSTLIVLGLLVSSLGGCASGGIRISALGQRFKAPDGGELYAFEVKTKRKATKPRAIIFYVPGSRCRSATGALGALAGFSAMDMRVVLLERRGIAGDRRIDAARCRQYSGKQQRVADHLFVMRRFLGELPAKIPVLLIGTSEGGDVAASIAAREPRVTHLLLLGSGGGWSQAEEIRYFIRTRGSYLGLRSQAELDRVLKQIRAEPRSPKIWAGNTYRRWSSFLWDAPRDQLLKVDRPIFLAQGARDENVPVQSARALVQAFEKAGKKNLTYREYPEADHSFKDKERGVSQLPLIEIDVLRWLEAHGLLSPQERRRFSERVRRNHPELFRVR